MAYLLFLDESGQDRRDSPYEVLAGIAVEDSRSWNLITDIQEAEVAHFGQRITRGELELKGRKLLKSKVFRMAGQLPEADSAQRLSLASECLREGRAARDDGRPAHVSRQQLTALAQAKIAFVRTVFELCLRHQARAFASIVEPRCPPPGGIVPSKGLRVPVRAIFLLA